MTTSEPLIFAPNATSNWCPPGRKLADLGIMPGCTLPSRQALDIASNHVPKPEQRRIYSRCYHVLIDEESFGLDSYRVGNVIDNMNTRDWNARVAFHIRAAFRDVMRDDYPGAMVCVPLHLDAAGSYQRPETVDRFARRRIASVRKWAGPRRVTAFLSPRWKAGGGLMPEANFAANLTAALDAADGVFLWGGDGRQLRADCERYIWAIKTALASSPSGGGQVGATPESTSSLKGASA